MEDSIDIDPTLLPPVITDTPPDTSTTSILIQPSLSPSYDSLSLSNPLTEQRPVGIFHWNTNEANTLWLTGWIPTMEDQYLSACLGLFLMAIVVRGLGGINIFFTTWLRAKDYNRLPIVVSKNKKVTSSNNNNNNSPNNMYNKRNSRASMFLLRQQQQQQEWNTPSTATPSVCSSITTQQQQPTTMMREMNRQDDNSIMMNDEKNENDTARIRSFMTPAASTLVTTNDSSPSSSRQQDQHQKAYIDSTKEFTSIDFPDNNNDYTITMDDPPMEENDDDDATTSYISAASTPYSINNKRRNRRNLSTTRTLERYYSTATSYNRNRYSINSNRKSHVEQQPQVPQQERRSILLSSAIPLTTTISSRRFMPSFEKAKIPWSPSFEWITDTLSSVLTTLEYFLMFLLTMIVMTGNGQYFISILLGIFIGEMIFGRLRGSIHQLPIHK